MIEDQKIFTKKWRKQFSELDGLDEFGIETKPGWNNLIWELSLSIQQYCKNSDLKVKVVQVKQKGGGLRYYISGEQNDIIWGMIQFAESYSFNICEICGEHFARTNKQNYVQTRCHKHTREISKTKSVGIDASPPSISIPTLFTHEVN